MVSAITRIVNSPKITLESVRSFDEMVREGKKPIILICPMDRFNYTRANLSGTFGK
jgi:hypothetical protein